MPSMTKENKLKAILKWKRGRQRKRVAKQKKYYLGKDSPMITFLPSKKISMNKATIKILDTPRYITYTITPNNELIIGNAKERVISYTYSVIYPSKKNNAIVTFPSFLYKMFPYKFKIGVSLIAREIRTEYNKGVKIVFPL